MAVRIPIKNSISPVDAADESDGRYCLYNVKLCKRKNEKIRHLPWLKVRMYTSLAKRMENRFNFFLLLIFIFEIVSFDKDWRTSGGLTTAK